jgi:hypothetical protein
VTEAKIADDLAVSLDVRALEILKQAAPLSNHLEAPSLAVMILWIGLEVVREVIDAIRKNRNLNPGRTGVGFVPFVLANRCCLFKSHVVYSPRDQSRFFAKFVEA